MEAAPGIHVLQNLFVITESAEETVAIRKEEIYITQIDNTRRSS